MKRNEKHVQPGSRKLLNNKGMQDQNRPVTSKELEDLLKLPPEEAIEKLLQHKSRYQLLVQKQELPDEVLKFLVQILVLAAAPGFRRENLHELFLMTCEKQFFNRLCSFVMRMKRKQPEKCHGFLNGLVTVLQAYAEAMTSVALERLPNLIDICLTVLPITADAGLMQKYEDLQNFLMEEKKKWYRGGFDRRTRGNISEWDDAEPPEDFREVPSFPTCKELLQRQQPFLRRNITEGSYKDDNHYLDVQFRLLREDFVRPLRNGINDFKEAVRNRDIRVYKGVTISRPVIKQGEILHVAHVKLPKHVNFEKSKRLMHESLLCLSNDGFQTLLCGTVANTDDLANEGRLEIKFKSNLRMEDLKGIFVMIECKAYFMAYKYVLQGLKDLADGVPFASYIVYVTSDVDPPEYLNEDTLYDLRVVKDLKLIRESHAGRIVPMSLLRRSRKSTLWGKNKNDPDPEASPLYNVPVTSELDAWPSSEELSLDDSQRRALHSALTRCFAIIQGPPGTGKTFIGLKITQILLHNRDIWNSEDNPNPILIISFTNHALDQFLEEISKCTNNIVRVGSRTKSEIIKRFQIKEVTRSLRRTINSEREYWIRNNITHAANLMEKLQNTSEEYESPSGIISMNVLSEVIPIHFLFQLQNMKGNLSLWLLDHRLLGQASMHTKRQTRPFRASLKKAPNEARSNSLHYEVTLDFLEKQSKPPSNKSNFFAQRNSQIQANRREMLQTGLQIPEDPVKSMELEQTGSNIWRLEITTRWQLYKHWVRKAQFQVLNELSLTKDNCRKLNEDLQNVRNELSLHAMKQASIVGMTTTTAARQAKVLKELAPSLVIIEEAAEILESHVVNSLTTKCKHVILIGDHKQLRPSATVHELAVSYGLEVSLFERMIRNGVPFETLEYQHRMRPNISKLLVPSIYSVLKDHPSVHEFPHVKGLQKDVFFFSHNYPEENKADDEVSHENKHEAKFIMGLCRYLMLQGYSANEVTILAAYSGQFFLLRKLQDKHPECRDVKICILDNFQGEENKIILLSLVRNNDRGIVGFLRTENRVCVALSRAKHGFYMAGNMDMLTAASDLWKKIKHDLLQEQSLGTALVLKCENHPERLQSVQCYEDFLDKSPQGGCLLQCNAKLPNCEHFCEWKCHIQDREHQTYKCNKPCSKVRCDLNHLCPKTCSEMCGPCRTVITKTLPCGHTCKMPCCEEICPALVEKEMAVCLHKVLVPCHSLKEARPCPEKCDRRLDCGHVCRLLCHATRDPDHDDYTCKKKCTRLNHECTQDHQCPKACGDPCDLCSVPVTKVLPCGHEANQVKCHMPEDEIRCSVKVCKTLLCGHEAQEVDCGIAIEDIKCSALTTRVLPCGHEVDYVLCGTATEEVLCRESCPETHPCGHACQRLCHEDCGECLVKVEKTLPDCGHVRQVECSFPVSNKKCDILLEKDLPCGHTASLPCHSPPERYMCISYVEVNLPACQHKVKKFCYQDIKTIVCPVTCDVTLNCGHACPRLCHRATDPGHRKDICKATCNRIVDGCLNKHKCQKECHEKCGPCEVLMSKPLPCGHTMNKVKCHLPVETMKCEKICRKPRPCRHGVCNHVCYLKCFCKEHVKKMVPSCGHTIMMECGAEPEASKCDGKCPKKLPCGHPCTAKCKEPCTKECQKQVTIKCLNNHPISVKCYQQEKDIEIISWYSCKKKCKQILSCGHACKGNCSSCLQGRVHEPCREQCNKKLICGHLCTSGCGEPLCPPCNQKCERRCTHKTCNRLCGMQCDPCQEQCQWSCEHHRCQSRCSDPCLKGPCDRPCKKKLPCGHPCIGFCGDVCPPLCRVCHKNLLKEAFLGAPQDLEHTRFVLLEDCGHTVESRALENHIKKYESQVGIKSCLECEVPIRNSRRFKDSLQEAYQAVDFAIYMYFVNTPFPELKGWHAFTAEIPKTSRNYQQAAHRFLNWMNQDKNYSLMEFSDFLLGKAARILKGWRKFKTLNQKEFTPHLQTLEAKMMASLFALLGRVLSPSSNAVTSQLKEEVHWELQRLENYACYIVMLKKRVGVGESSGLLARVRASVARRRVLAGVKAEARGGGVAASPEASSHFAEFPRLVDPRVTFGEGAQHQVREFMKSKGIDDEDLRRFELEKFQSRIAMGLSAGRWFRCPQGDFYYQAESNDMGSDDKCPYCNAFVKAQEQQQAGNDVTEGQQE